MNIDEKDFIKAFIRNYKRDGKIKLNQNNIDLICKYKEDMTKLIERVTTELETLNEILSKAMR